MKNHFSWLPETVKKWKHGILLSMEELDKSYNVCSKRNETKVKDKMYKLLNKNSGLLNLNYINSFLMRVNIIYKKVSHHLLYNTINIAVLHLWMFKKSSKKIFHLVEFGHICNYTLEKVICIQC